MPLMRSGKPRPTGRPSKLTPDVHEKIVDVVGSGCFMETAAAYAGVNSWTFKEWLRRGRDDLKLKRENRFTRLVEAIEEARARTEVTRVARIAKAGRDGDWKADAWWLEHAMQDRYAVIRMKHEGKIELQARPMIDPAKGTVEQLQMLRDLLEIFAPDADDPALDEQARPALELVEGIDFIEHAAEQ